MSQSHRWKADFVSCCRYDWATWKTSGLCLSMAMHFSETPLDSSKYWINVIQLGSFGIKYTNIKTELYNISVHMQVFCCSVGKVLMLGGSCRLSVCCQTSFKPVRFPWLHSLHVTDCLYCWVHFALSFIDNPTMQRLATEFRMSS